MPGGERRKNIDEILRDGTQRNERKATRVRNNGKKGG